MIKIYCLYADRGPFVLYEEPGFVHKHFQGKKEIEDWQVPELNISKKSKPLVDLLFAGLGAYCVSDKFCRVMGSLLNDYVEYLPVGDIKGNLYYILNVVKVIDCLDIEKSDIFYSTSEPKKILGVNQFVFKKVSIKAPIFKVPEELGCIFVNEKFTDMVLKNNITGVGLDEPNDIRFVKDKVVLEGFPT
jgi:hypothetical protein